MAIEHNRKRVLVVDSESGWRERITAWLSANFVVTIASNYTEALDHLSRQEDLFQVVVTEISLN